MKENMIKGTSFFDELILRLQKENIEFRPIEKNGLPILMDSREVAVVTPEGTIHIKKRNLQCARL